MTAASSRFAAAGLWLALVSATPLAAHAAGGTVAIDLPKLKATAPLTVSIPDVTPDAPLPIGYTAEGRNLSPPVSWSAGPKGTRGYVVIAQDPDAPPATPLVHWIVWDIPAEVLALPRGIRNVESPTTPLVSAQGQNYHGSVGYSGPRPPPGDAPHHYHFQVFAMDRPLRVRPGGDPRAVLAAMAGHVLASGELVATFATPATKGAPGARKPAV